MLELTTRSNYYCTVTFHASILSHTNFHVKLVHSPPWIQSVVTSTLYKPRKCLIIILCKAAVYFCRNKKMTQKKSFICRSQIWIGIVEDVKISEISYCRLAYYLKVLFEATASLTVCS